MGYMLEVMFDYTVPVPDEDIDGLVADWAKEGIVATREEARGAILRVAELLDLISAPIPGEPGFKGETPV